ncbi:alpha/beta hydrolase [Flavihumibacter sp. UBA7668]|uniref:alpha/beta hydrolase n=1 Tax=Flavihumibacter sp. UBA7668 TaxID=1946542 RepID=UPI0025BCADAC|nr:dienelactone hydrolase family protein [Flavihumibacter sp. UBA7668]
MTTKAHKKQVVYEGVPLASANKAMILLHGRGASAESILSLKEYLKLDGFALLAPEATNHTWYPFSFMAPSEQNEPWLSSAIELIETLVAECTAAGIAESSIHLLGFSQGACLTLEFAARTATRYGSVTAFTGGLIGEKINRSNYSGNFNGTPVFIGCSDRDMHVPVERVYASTNVLTEMGAKVIEKIYPGMGHTINEDEINIVNKLLNETT